MLFFIALDVLNYIGGLRNHPKKGSALYFAIGIVFSQHYNI